MALAKFLKEIGYSAKDADFIGLTQEADIEATGTNQATGYPLTNSINEVAAGSAGTGDCLTLPVLTSYKSSLLVVRSNYIGFPVDIFPAEGDEINGNGVDVALSLPAGKAAIFMPLTETRWLAFMSDA